MILKIDFRCFALRSSKSKIYANNGFMPIFRHGGDSATDAIPQRMFGAAGNICAYFEFVFFSFLLL
jgi:hypothetical protein